MKLERALSLGARELQPSPAKGARISFFEFWPGWLFYAPVVAHWIALGLRHGDLSLPTAANPLIDAGGLCGESKRGIFALAGAEAHEWIAPYASMTTHAWSAEADVATAEAAMADAGITYPVVAKPDIGCNGTGVRLVETPADLLRYMTEFPRGTAMMLQQKVEFEGEAGIFYVRLPGESVGRITSVTLKHAPSVTGDGASTLRALILADPRAGKVPHLYLPRLARRLHTIPRAGERVRLVFTGNHCKGSLFENGENEVTPALSARIESIARDIRDFHFGRIDMRYESLHALRRGEGFKIIEVNGVGSEATHIWDPSTRLMDAWRTQFAHYGAAFRIAAANRAAGRRSSGIREMNRLWRLQRRLLASYPTND